MSDEKIRRLLSEIKEDPLCKEQVVHIEYFPAHPARYAELEPPLPQPVTDYLKSKRLERLFSHQVAAITALRQGKDVAVVTPTASGKTLIYNLAVAEKLLRNPQIKALYLFPLKALAQDQLKSLRELFAVLGSTYQAAIYDGDTSSYQRSKIRKQPPQVVLTNPDMLHLGLLPYHGNWAEFFRNLSFIIIDEIHSYRGVMGSHLAMVLRRLLRVCGNYAATPQFIVSSATVANPETFIQQLTSRSIDVIEESGAPQSGKYFMLYRPDKSPYTEASKLFTKCLERNLKTIMFTKARKITELLSLWIKENRPRLQEEIRAYRAGYLSEERREIEQLLFCDKLKGVISTSALEAGIDVGGLDACILVGYPGTIISTWQRSGRVGRADAASLVVLIGLADPLDQYFLNHPTEFFNHNYEEAICDLSNRYIVSQHLLCAAQELPLSINDTFFPTAVFTPFLEEAQKNGKLALSADGQTWHTLLKYPQREVNIRSIGEQYVIKDKTSGQLIGTIESPRVFQECYPQAIYLHGGRYYKVEKLDVASRLVEVMPAEVDYYTQPNTSREITAGEPLLILNENFSLCRLRVTEKVYSYERKLIARPQVQAVFPLDLPAHTFETVGLRIQFPAAFTSPLKKQSVDLTGGLHAAEHALIAIFPLFALCDCLDLGGASYETYPETARATIFIFDGYPGGIGLAEKGFLNIKKLLETASKLIRDCDCEAGCPACIHSPKCGSGNYPLSKSAALLLLDYLQTSDFSKELTVPAKAVENPLITKTIPATPVPPAKAAQEPHNPARVYRPDNLVFFDIETQFLSHEVGGWQHCERMKLSLAVTYSTAKGEFRVFTEADVYALLDELLAAELVIGFNINRFDYVVLQPYFQYDLRKLPTFDILDYVYQKLNFRLSLDHLAKNSLGKAKLADGLMAVKWFRAGEMEKLAQYCQSDVEITRDLYYFGKQFGYLLYQKNNQLFQLPVDW